MKNTIKNVGIVGQGFVGKAVTEKFKETNTVFAYDLDESKRGVFTGKEARYDKELNLTTLVKNSDVVFVCVPTPMFKSGKCDVSIVDNVISNLNKISAELDKDILVVIKSTVPPGTTESFNKTYSRVGVSFSPEFLTEANSVEDFKNQTRIILGIDWLEYVKPLTSLFETAFPDTKIAVLNTVEAELSKYVTNLFLATKVSFFNDMYKLTEAINRDKTISHDINFESVTSATLLDPRIGKSHYMVPGPDGDFGYGGHCFPGNYTIKTPNGNVTLEEAYEKYTSGELLECLSFDHNVENLETKIVKEVTKNYYEGELLTFELENGTSFKCTPEHLFPIERSGKLLLVQAKNITENDKFYNVSEHINKNQKALTYDNELFRREEK